MTEFDQRLAPEFFDRVQTGVRDRMGAQGFDAFLTDHPEDIAYLTGFFHHPSERPVAIWIEANGRVVMLLPELEREYAESQSARAELVAFFEFPGVVAPFEALARAVSPRGRVGFASSMPFSRLSAAREAMPGADLVASDLLTRARFVKFPEEVTLHREAARVTDRMLEAGVSLVVEAVAAGGELPTEAELERHVTATGTGIMYAEHRNVVVASLLAGGLVYSGANSAFPHGLPSVNRLKAGDTFMLSLGCAVGGRFIEGERTFVLGEPTAEQRRYHDTINAAQQLGRETIRAGLECREANRLCLDVIRGAGLGAFIRHRQGHGIGLGMHEAPWLEDGDATLLEAGMVVSNEPGIYVPRHAGYRISDSMLVTDTGAEPLTTYPRSLDDCIIAL
ncbi:Xaa-Pro peptidase family protein [Microbacterium sp.]|uniref:M24 family metallopeptidase n=1 Tax=Microbacterium sp. TaxID=51671 RepID=UPI002634F82E|nr:Xaa-Pro peptidase family protein [Microbacterium sp.]MCV0335102.1 Xaa-Pro peptidase family protein [Microbacterium sp.]MCV0375205.1 Xaa-Pro peptidase family protein [Microbacterium sp.]MCV0388276.1 Xaa-Pro peptidase family protein [Microbacterium sp.]MCV0416803.1 Xaa-Pro peptidase family protein [Microbacterium sp.]MCV0423416.1 Xaa-Pro peptidase family protein [Microbacterium sp.]